VNQSLCRLTTKVVLVTHPPAAARPSTLCLPPPAPVSSLGASDSSACSPHPLRLVSVGLPVLAACLSLCRFRSFFCLSQSICGIISPCLPAGVRVQSLCVSSCAHYSESSAGLCPAAPACQYLPVSVIIMADVRCKCMSLRAQCPSARLCLSACVRSGPRPQRPACL
jgi:hypothetical protein